jgi:hypothetical protein
MRLVQVYEPQLRPELHHPEVDSEWRYAGGTVHAARRGAGHGAYLQLPAGERRGHQEEVPLRGQELLR